MKFKNNISWQVSYSHNWILITLTIMRIFKKMNYWQMQKLKLVILFCFSRIQFFVFQNVKFPWNHWSKRFLLNSHYYNNVEVLNCSIYNCYHFCYFQFQWYEKSIAHYLHISYLHVVLISFKFSIHVLCLTFAEGMSAQGMWF